MGRGGGDNDGRLINLELYQLFTYVLMTVSFCLMVTSFIGYSRAGSRIIPFLDNGTAIVSDFLFIL